MSFLYVFLVVWTYVADESISNGERMAFESENIAGQLIHHEENVELLLSTRGRTDPFKIIPARIQMTPA
jgi:hypothetical protein